MSQILAAIGAVVAGAVLVFRNWGRVAKLFPQTPSTPDEHAPLPPTGTPDAATRFVEISRARETLIDNGADQEALDAVVYPLLPKLLAVAVLVAACCLGGVGCQERPQPQPAPTPFVNASLADQVTAAFATRPNGKQHAAQFAAILREAAERIRWDGMRPTPILKDGRAIDSFCKNLREFSTKGYSFLGDHPQLRPVIAAELDRSVGKQPGPVDAARRAAWADSLDLLAAACDVAAGRL